MRTALHLLDKRDWTVDEVANLPEDLTYELLDGRLVLTPSPLPIHQFISRKLANALEVECPDGLVVTEDQSVLLDSRNEPRPDVVLTRESGAGRTPVLAADVLLAVEIVSPESSVRDCRDKLKLYADAGIATYWIVDPRGDRVTFTEWLLNEGGIYEQHVQTDGLITLERPWETTLDLPAWTRRRDRIREATGLNA